MNIIQPAVSADGNEIERIMSANQNFTGVDRDCVKELWEDYVKRESDSCYQFCACRDGETGLLTGFACYGKHALTDSTYDLYWIAVDPVVQRTGAGTGLLAYVEEQVLRQEGRRLIIETSSTAPYTAARKFYRRSHYHKEAVLRDFYSPGDDLVFFTKYFRSGNNNDPGLSPSDDQLMEHDFRIRGGKKQYFYPD